MSIIDTIGSKFKNLAAPNRFIIELIFPFGGDTEFASFMCKGATIPSETVGEVLLGYQSQKLKLAGDREFDDWTVTVYSTEEWKVRNDIEKWVKLINDPETNLKSDHAAYMTDLKITQKSVQDTDVAIYILKGAWPTSIGEITLDWESNDEVATFDITFKYQYFTRG